MVNPQAAFGAKVRGAAHIKNGKPCQDALLISTDEEKRYFAVYVADGHGSAQCAYSDDGAQVAVESAHSVFYSIFCENTAAEAGELLNAHKDIWLPKKIESEWKERVKKFHSDKERMLSEPFPFLLYGSTLLVLIVSDGFIFSMQLGDGDIVSISDGKADWILKPERVGVYVHSLCLENSWQYFRSVWTPQPEGTESPEMFLVSTDGYSDCFLSDAGFLQAVTDIHHLFKSSGKEATEEQLAHWLEESSAAGSGDDITLAILPSGNIV